MPGSRLPAQPDESYRRTSEVAFAAPPTITTWTRLLRSSVAECSQLMPSDGAVTRKKSAQCSTIIFCRTAA